MPHPSLWPVSLMKMMPFIGQLLWALYLFSCHHTRIDPRFVGPAVEKLCLKKEITSANAVRVIGPQRHTCRGAALKTKLPQLHHKATWASDSAKDRWV